MLSPMAAAAPGPAPGPRVRVAHIATLDISLRYLLQNQLVSLIAAGYDVTGISAPAPTWSPSSPPASSTSRSP